MFFTPFAFRNTQVATPGAITSPLEIIDCTFWLDFSNTSSMTVSGSLITSITSSITIASRSIDISQGLTRTNSNYNYYKLTSSFSNPSLNCGVVTAYPTQYTSDKYNVASNDYIVQGPKTNTTSYPDGMTFMVINKEAVDQLGYLMCRWTGTSDRGALFTENRTGAGYPSKTPYLTTGVYDFGVSSPQVQYFDDNNNQNVILTRENDGATRTVWRGSTQTATNSGGNDTQNRSTRQFYHLGRYGSQLGSTEQTPIGTRYCEIIHYNRVLTSTERQQVWDYLSNKWDISL